MTTEHSHGQDEQLIPDLRRLLSPSIDERLVSHGEEGLSNDTLKRWLRARKFDTQLAAKDLTLHAAWRKKHVPEGGVSEDTVQPFVKRRYCFITGSDSQGHPTMLVIGRKHQPQELDMTRRWILYCLDTLLLCGQMGRSMGREWDGKVVGIFDLRAFGWSNSDLSGLRAVFDILQNHYVERLFKLYLYCAPTVFWGLWKMIAPIIDPVSREKVVFCDESNARQLMLAHLNDEAIPTELGGKAQPLAMNEVQRIAFQQKEQLSK